MHKTYRLLPVLLTAVGAACGSAPLIEDIQLNSQPSETVPLAAELLIRTDKPTTVALEFDDGLRTWRVETGVPFDTTHAVPVLGLRPGNVHRIRVEVEDEGGRTMSLGGVELTTPPLPAGFPPLFTNLSQPDRMEPGITLFDIHHRPPGGGDDLDFGLLVAVDEAGEVVWYYQTDFIIDDARRLQNGNILHTAGRTGHLYEIDMLGRVVRQWHSRRNTSEGLEDSVAVDTDTFHHEAFEMTSGNILALSSEIRTYPDYPTSTEDANAPRSPSDVIGDVLVEFDREGRIVRRVGLLDILDPYRIGFGSLAAGFLGSVYRETAENPLRDWAHANAVVADADGRYALASLRHQAAVIKVDLETGELVWILGDHDGWGPEWQEYLLTPTDDMQWQYHQHAPMFTPEGTILLFDNGNFRAQPFFGEPIPDAELFSRAVEYRIDEEAMEVTEVWSYGGPGDEQYFSSFVSDADWLPGTGNVLATFGGLISEGRNWSRVVEVTHETPAEKVFELFVDDPGESWFIYRADRLPGLYP